MIKLKTIMFDLGGVYFVNGTTTFISFLVDTHGVEHEAAEEIVNGALGSDYRIGRMSREEFWTEALKVWGPIEEPDILSLKWLSGYIPMPETVDIVDKLDKAGYELLFLSDNVAERVEYLESNYSFQHYFKDGVFSHMVGERKPHEKMYKAALEKTTSTPSECLFIDDKQSNLLPAKELGMHTLLFTTGEQLDADLKELGFEY